MGIKQKKKKCSKNTTTSSRFSSSATLVLESHAYSSDSQTINFKKTSCQPSESILKSAPLTQTTRSASCRSGTLLARNALRRSPPPIIRELTASSSPTISQTEIPSTPCTHG